MSRYINDLSDFVILSFSNNKKKEGIRNHVTLRASSMHLMYMASEISIITAIWYDNPSITSIGNVSIILLLFGIIGFILTLMQDIITRKIDWDSVNK